MFTLDSDLMGILMALLTFLVPLISALLEIKRKKREGISKDILPDEELVLVQHKPAQEHNSQQERLDELEEMFNLILGREPQDEVETSVEVKPELEMGQVEEFVAEEGKSAVTDNVPQVVVKDVDTQEEETPKRLKERLKDNPKDIVVFSAILNPKFKEY